MRYILKFNENIQQAEKIFLTNKEYFGNIEFDYITKNNKYKNYLGPYLKILLNSETNVYNYLIDIDKILNDVNKYKLNINKYENIYELMDDIDENNTKSIINKFINKWAPSSLRNEIKKDIFDNFDKYNKEKKHPLFNKANQKYMTYDSLPDSKENKLKTGSLAKTPNEWYDIVSNALNKSHHWKKLKENKDIEILFEDEDYIIYKPHTFEGMQIISFEWCTRIERYFNYYKNLNLIIYLNKHDIYNSYLSYYSKTKKGKLKLQAFNYMGRNIGSDGVKRNKYLQMFRKYKEDK
jgi:hypothetical protein